MRLRRIEITVKQSLNKVLVVWCYDQVRLFSHFQVVFIVFPPSHLQSEYIYV